MDILGDTDKLIISKNKDTSFDVSEEPENNIESSSQESENIVLELKEVDGKIKKKKKKK